MANQRDEEYDFYEDEKKEAGVVPFLIREKQIVLYLVTFLLCTLVFSCIGRQMDGLGGHSEAVMKGEGSKKNPWAKD